MTQQNLMRNNNMKLLKGTNNVHLSEREGIKMLRSRGSENVCVVLCDAAASPSWFSCFHGNPGTIRAWIENDGY